MLCVVKLIILILNCFPLTLNLFQNPNPKLSLPTSPMTSPRLPGYDVKIVGGKKIIIWNNQDQDEPVHKNGDLSEGGRKLKDKNYEPEEESFSSPIRPAPSTKYIKVPHSVAEGWGFRSVQV